MEDSPVNLLIGLVGMIAMETLNSWIATLVGILSATWLLIQIIEKIVSMPLSSRFNFPFTSDNVSLARFQTDSIRQASGSAPLAPPSA